MNIFKYLLGVFLSLALVACGGGGGNASAPAAASSAPSAAVAASIVEVLTSTNSVLSSGSEVVITAFVKNSGNVGLQGQTVSFSASSGVVQVVSAVSDANGAVSAKLSAGSNKSIRDITVTVTAGSVSGSVVVPVTGTRVSIAGSGAVQVGGAAETYTVRAVDSSGNAINGAAIAVSSSLGNGLSAKSITTDSTGAATFIYTPNVAGTDTLTVAGLGTSGNATVVVNNVDFVVVSPASNVSIPVNTAQTITFRYRLGGAGQANSTVSFSTTRGVLTVSSATTDASGDASTVVSSTTAGAAVVVAQIPGVGQVNLPVQFVATTPASISVQASPGALLPNSSGSANKSSIEAVVRDVSGNAIANRQVNFTIVNDVSNGSLSPGVATTDANGRAQVQFISGATSTPAKGVVIQATVAGTAIAGTTSLTVNGQALFITLAFGNTISNVDETTYSKPFSVYVTDANGVAVGNQVVSLSVIPEEYYKGFLETGSVGGITSWKYSTLQLSGLISPTATCANEDANRDGILQSGEDTNGNGILTPGNMAVAAPGTVTTDANGRASFELQYGEQFALWATVRITARASVAGSESTQSILFWLSMRASDMNDLTTTPANIVSPFGQSGLCTNAQ